MRTWREKLDSNGSPIWLRRSRFVAREFAWLQPERESLFSPASSAITSRILPAIFLEMRSQCSAVLASLDVKDAFLTVDQQEPTLVHTTDAAGNPQSFSLGKSFARTTRWVIALVSGHHVLFEITVEHGGASSVSLPSQEP